MDFAQRGFAALTLTVIFLAVLFGGATRPGFLGDVIVQLAAVPLLLWSLNRLRDQGSLGSAPVLFCVALCLLPLIHVVPLPPALWTALPQRDVAQGALALAGQDVGWRPLSLDPAQTWLILPALVPGLAVLLAVISMSHRQRRLVVFGLLAAALLSAGFGLIQDTPANKFADTLIENSGSRGFFVNRNHFAALCYAMIVFACALAADATRELAAQSRSDWRTRDILMGVGSIAFILVLLTAIVLSRSRAGLILALLALVCGGLVTASDRRASVLGAKSRILIVVGVVGFIGAAQFALLRVIGRFQDPLQEARLTFIDVTWRAAKDFWPFGSGLGSFVTVYKTYEQPNGIVPGLYVNRAHNELLDLLLEAGLPGVVLFAGFMVWFALRLWRVWRGVGHGSPLDRLLTRAASLVVLLLLAHGLVDYPMRTAAMAAVFALCCGMLVAPARPQHASDLDDLDGDDSAEPTVVTRVASAPPRRAFEGGWGPRVASGEPRAAEPPHSSAPPRDFPSGPKPAGSSTGRPNSWGDGIQWPEDWRPPSKVDEKDK